MVGWVDIFNQPLFHPKTGCNLKTNQQTSSLRSFIHILIFFKQSLITSCKI